MNMEEELKKIEKVKNVGEIVRIDRDDYIIPNKKILIMSSEKKGKGVIHIFRPYYNLQKWGIVALEEITKKYGIDSELPFTSGYIEAVARDEASGYTIRFPPDNNIRGPSIKIDKINLLEEAVNKINNASKMLDDIMEEEDRIMHDKVLKYLKSKKS